MNAFLSHFSFEFRTGLRDRAQLLMNYLFPLGFYLVVSLLMTQLNPSFRDSIIPAMVIFVSMASMILSLPNPLVAAREAGIFRAYRINGVPAKSILIIPALTTGAHTIIASVIITLTAPVLFHAPLPANWGGFAVFVLLTVFVMAGLGVLIGVISANTRITILWSQVIFLPSIMIGGVMVPRSALTGMIAKIGGLFPSTHAMLLYQEITQSAVISGQAILSLLVLLSGGLLAFFLAVYLFSWDSNNTAPRSRTILAALVLLPFIIGMALLR